MKCFGLDVSTSVLSQATKQLFKVGEDAEQLSDKKGYIFPSVVEKLLFIVKRSRPYL